MSPPIHRHEALDGLRGVAAVAVVLHHALSPFDLHKSLLPHAQLAVDFFFALSGFVLAAAYGDRLRAGLGWIDLMRLRWLRLYPLTLLGLALGLLVWLGRAATAPWSVDGAGVLRALACHLLMLPDLGALFSGQGSAWPLNVALWSLSVEMLLSALFAAGWWAWRPTSLAAALALATVGLGCAVWVEGSVRGGHDGQTWITGVLRGLQPFLSGMLVWHALGHAADCRRSPWRAALALLALAALLLTPTLGTTALHEGLAVLVWIPLVVALGGTARVPQRWAGLNAALGRLSFPLYALHYPLVQVASGLARRWGLDGPVLLGWVLLELLLAALLAGVAAHWAEPPLRRWLARPAGAAQPA